jgi:beta-glucosidase
MDPVLLGHYPEDVLDVMGEDAPAGHECDMGTICQPLDFFGVNIYSGTTVRAAADGSVEPLQPAPGSPRATYTPECLYWGPRFFHERYKLPVVITENGYDSAQADTADLDGRVRDPQRVNFMRRHLRELRRAADEIPVGGYFHWSLMDNLEWCGGYRHRMGLIHVDFETQQRTLKDSAYWYKNVIETNGGDLAGETPSP